MGGDNQATSSTLRTATTVLVMLLSVLVAVVLGFIAVALFGIWSTIGFVVFAGAVVALAVVIRKENRA